MQRETEREENIIQRKREGETNAEKRHIHMKK